MQAEQHEFEPVDIQRRILVSFCVTVLIGFGLGVVYMVNRSAPHSPGPARNYGWSTVSVPDPPTPLPGSASPYLSGIPPRLKLENAGD